MRVFCSGNKNKEDFVDVLSNVKSIIEKNGCKFYLDKDKSISTLDCNLLSFENIQNTKKANYHLHNHHTNDFSCESRFQTIRGITNSSPSTITCKKYT